MDIKRVLTTVLGLPLVIAIIFYGNTIVTDVFFALIALIAIKEYFDAFEKTGNAKPVRWIGYIVSLSIAVLRLFHLQTTLVDIDVDMINMMSVLVIFSVFVSFFSVLNSGMKTNIVDGAITVFGILYIPVLTMFMTIIRNSNNGLILFWYIIICGWRNRCICIFSRKIV